MQNVHESERILTGVVGAALLGMSMGRRSPEGGLMAAAGAVLAHRALTGFCPVYAAMGKAPEYPDHSANTVVAHAPKVDCQVMIHMPPEELYPFWRNLENLPLFMRHLESVERLDERRSRWTALGPLGLPISWEAEIFREEPDRVIAWRSLPGQAIRQAGAVRFVPRADGEFTELRVSLQYSPPLGRAGAAVAHLLGADPEKQIREDLEQMKRMLEAELEQSSYDRM